jgi:hypothetical protein
MSYTLPHTRSSDDSTIAARLGLRRPPIWLWSVSVGVQVVIAALLTSYTYFFFDDFLFLQQARVQHFGLSYLREPLFEHFSPVSRVLDTALVHIAPGSFALAHGVQLAIYALAIVAFAVVAVTALGNRWTAFALTGIFGQSIFLMRMLHWWTATANTLPATVFMLIALAGYLRWRLAGSRLWLIASIISYALALADYETAILFPVYLGLIAFPVLEDRFNPRAWLSRLWAERWAWLCYVALAIAGLYNYYEYYYASTPRPPFHELLHFLWIALFESFVPALFGIKDPEASLSSHAGVIVATIVLAVAVIAVTLYFRPRAWRCVAAFAIVFLITMVPIGLNRVGVYGVGTGQELDYQQSVQFMFLVLAAFALSPRWGGQRGLSDGAHRRLATMRPSPAIVAIACAVVIAGYGVLYVTSVHAMSKAAWEPRLARNYIDAFRAGVGRVKAQTGSEPNLIDHEVPENIQFSSFAPYNHYDQFFGMFDANLRIDQVSRRSYFVTNNGALLPVEFVTRTSGVLDSASVSNPDGSNVVPATRSATSACTPAGAAEMRLHVRLPSPQTTVPTSSGLPYALRVFYRVPARVGINILLGDAGNLIVDDGFPHIWGPGDGGEIAPLTLKTAFDEIALELPGGTCVTSLAFGQFSLTGEPID